MELLPIVDQDESRPDAARPDAIPAETWQALQAAGQAAAERLRDLLEAPAFARLKPGDQARLIELALTRAYGPPVQRQLSLSLSGTVSDAVAESLARLSAADLPEYGRSAMERAADGASREKTKQGGRKRT